MTASRAFALRLIGTGLVLLLLGCGQKFELPPQPEAGRIPTPGKYNLDKVWDVDGSPTDLVSQGSYLYVIEDSQRVVTYITRSKTPQHPVFVDPFEGLVKPVQLALSRRDSTYLLVADAGDRTIKRYLFTGGPPRFTFTDSIWRGDFAGLAADSKLNVYVSFAHSDSILKYDAAGTRVRLISNTGTGSGYVRRPSGLYWTGYDLLVADTGNNLVKRVDTDTTYVSTAPPVGDPLLAGPRDVVSDRQNEVLYVADTERNRVLKFLRTGDLVDSVYSLTKAETRLDVPLYAPRFVAIEESLVFVSDPGNKRVVAFRLANL
jgi:sugar lactone lactonase YvrE